MQQTATVSASPSEAPRRQRFRQGRRPMPRFMALYRLRTEDTIGPYQTGRLKDGSLVCYDIALLPGRRPREEGYEFLGLGERVNAIQWDH